MIDDNLWVGMFLVDTSAASCKAFRADVRIVWREDASDLAATACIDQTMFGSNEMNQKQSLDDEDEIEM